MEHMIVIFSRNNLSMLLYAYSTCVKSACVCDLAELPAIFFSVLYCLFLQF